MLLELGTYEYAAMGSVTSVIDRFEGLPVQDLSSFAFSDVVSRRCGGLPN